MILRPLALICALFCAAQPALSRDLPTGEFLLTGPVLPGVKDGNIIPVYVHLTTRPNHLEWRFVTFFGGDVWNCENSQKCQHVVQTLNHDVAWQDDGRLKITGTQRENGEGLTIDRPEADEEFIYPEIQNLVELGILDLSASGGTWLTKSDGPTLIKGIKLTPMTLEQTREAIAYMAIFELSLGRLDYCGISQIAHLINKTPPTEAIEELQTVMKLARLVKDLSDRSQFYARSDKAPPDPAAHALNEAQLRALQVAFPAGSQIANKHIIETGKLPSDAEIWASITEAAKKFDEQISPDLKEPLVVFLSSRRAGLIGTSKLLARFIHTLQEGLDPYQVVCSDVTLRSYLRN